MIVKQQDIQHQIDVKKYIAKIIKSENAKGDIFIPYSINHKCIKFEIKEISEESFKNSKIKSITFEEDSNIISIPKNAFISSTIEKLHISANIQRLRNGWCCKTPNLKSITISPKNAYFQIYNNQILVGRNNENEANYDAIYFAFRNIETITIPPEIKFINPYSFEFCQKIKHVFFTNDSKLKTICKFSFANSTIESIVIPKSITNIEHEAFYNCEHIKSFELDNELRIKSNNCKIFETKNISESLDFLIHCKLMISQIDNDVIQKMYSKFTFNYINFNDYADNEEDFVINFCNYLREFKFAVYSFYNLSKNGNNICIDYSITPISNCILCVEDKIFIIEHLNSELFNKHLKEQQLSLINLSIKDTEKDTKEMIQNFCIKYSETIKKNYFVEYTIKPIVGYMICRNYYPSHFFKNPSFFKFEQSKNDFNENEFITLANLYSNNNNIFDLVIHIETFHLFVIKKYIESKLKHEEQFCTKLSHPNFTRFYGFLKNGEKKIGIVYEFMSNGPIFNYIKKTKKDYMYLMFIIIRISEGIEYLHKNGLIHRDIKPFNILIDHNGIPYISDFETIRSTDISDGEFTNNIGSKYSSPEQDDGSAISYATDIYSLGRFIFYLYENDSILTLFNKEIIYPMIKGPEIAHYLYKRCVQYKQEDRIKIDEISFILLDNYLSFYSLFEQYLTNGLEQDYLKAKQFYEDSANLNISHVLLNLGNFYFIGDGVKQDYLKAKQYYEESADLGNSDAINKIGNLYYSGYGVKQDYLKAKEYYEKAANLDNPDAINNLGVLYKDGLGVEQNYLKAKEYYEKAANLNNSNALNNLGNLYYDGCGDIKQDYLKAKEYYEKASNLNNPDAINNMGYLYEEGQGVKQDHLKAKEYYEKAANLNNPDAMNNLGELYKNGLGVEQNYLKAKEYYEKAANLNNPNALNNLGDLYYDGLGVEQNYLKAKEYYEMAANLNDSNAMNNIGILYEYGYGVEKDYLKAKEYYEKAAKLNDSTALNNLGDLYYHGYGVEKDYLRAKYYYEKAANLNFPDAFIMLGDLYYYGYGVEQNYVKSKYFYEKSSDFNNSEGLVKLGDLYYHGYGVDQDYLKAKSYYEKAAKFDFSDAFNKLGDLYYYGHGVEQDYLKSKYFYEKSSNLNDSYAHYCLADIYSNNDTIDNNLQKAINYFTKCIIIQRGEQIISYIRTDNITQIIFSPNNYRNISYNDLGLIYLIEMEDKEKANENLKKSYFAEYPFGQNSFGLFNQLYLHDQNNIENVKYMFKRSSEHKFSLAEYNLGIIYEKENDIEKSIKYFIQASEHENEPLMFFNIKRFDKRLEISKMFIICLNDFKLIEYYFSQNNFDESKKYFIKIINKLKYYSKKLFYPFEFKIQCENETQEHFLHDFFSYLKRYIFNFPLFNLINQPNLYLNKYSGIFNQNDTIKCQTEITDDKISDSSSNNGNEKSENIKYLNDKPNDSYLMKKISYISDYVNDQRINITNKNVKIYTDPSCLFDFIVRKINSKNKAIFIDEIKNIIYIMNDILYTPPYPILFGRIYIKKSKSDLIENREDKRKIIDKSFYDGFYQALHD